MKLSRRAVIGTIAAGTASAGCLSAGLANPENGGPEIEDDSIETVAAECDGASDDRANVVHDDDGLVITGQITASDPCHEAVFDAVEIDDGRLDVIVDVESTGEVCVECVGAIEYEAEIAVDEPSDLEEVRVDHHDGGSFTFGWSEIDEHAGELAGSGPELLETAIDTTGADCGGPDDDRADFDLADDRVTVTGTIPAPNPCHRAVLADSALEGDTLELHVDVESTLGSDEDCAACHGAIRYEATADVSDLVDVEHIRVTHETGGEFGMSQTGRRICEPDSDGDHIGDPGDSVNARVYNERSETTTVGITVTDHDGSVTLNEEVTVDGGAATGLGHVGEVGKSYTVTVVDGADDPATEDVEIGGKGTIEIRVADEGQVEIVFVPID